VCLSVTPPRLNWDDGVRKWDGNWVRSDEHLLVPEIHYGSTLIACRPARKQLLWTSIRFLAEALGGLGIIKSIAERSCMTRHTGIEPVSQARAVAFVSTAPRP
jgi:hypothetical protein